MVVARFEVYLVRLDPTQGHEIRKTRPCVVISPDEMNRHIGTVIVAPLTTKVVPIPPAFLSVFREKAVRSSWTRFARLIRLVWCDAWAKSVIRPHEKS